MDVCQNWLNFKLLECQNKICLHVILSQLVLALIAQLNSASDSIDFDTDLGGEFDIIETTTELQYDDYGDNVTGKEKTKLKR